MGHLSRIDGPVSIRFKCVYYYKGEADEKVVCSIVKCFVK